MASQRIAAIIVTYNRLAELQANVHALHSQTRPPDKIIIVNNDSTDGTRAWLDAQPDLHVIHQANRGAGSGFASGLNAMVEMGYDWGWCLDDDAIPEPEALGALCRAMEARPDARVFNSVGLAANDPTQFASGALCVRTTPENYLVGQNVTAPGLLAPFMDANGMIDSIGGHFWLGTCIHHTVVRSVGVPYEWLMMRGDEVEYGLRIMRAGFHIYVVEASHVLHPQMPFVTVNLLGHHKTLKNTTTIKWYYALRNGVWIQRTYYAQFPLLPYVGRRLGGALLMELFIAPNKSLGERFASSRSAVRGVVDGMRLPLSLDTAGKNSTG